MRTYLLPENGQFYKANLHCHSTISDGQLTPEEIKEAYKQRGYSVVAYTDHNILVPHPELQSDDFVALYGMEYYFDEVLPGQSWEQSRTTHFCLISLDPENVIQPCFYQPNWFYDRLLERNDPRYKVTLDPNEPVYERVFTPDGVNEVIKTAHEKGFFVTYNHPKWAKECYETYSQYKGMHAIEICNYGSYVKGFHEYNTKVYEEKLHNGEKIFGISADDNHNFEPFDSPYNDSFGAFTMIKAENLDYRSITDAMTKGHFYASMGPEIYSMYLEGNKLHVKTSDAAIINFTSGIRHCYNEYCPEGGKLNEVIFDVWPQDIFFRVTVCDKEGRRATSNAYFVEDYIK